MGFFKPRKVYSHNFIALKNNAGIVSKIKIVPPTDFSPNLKRRGYFNAGISRVNKFCVTQHVDF
jgi:hypothetical protein